MKERSEIQPWQLLVSMLFRPSATINSITDAVNTRYIYDKDGVKIDRDDHVKTLLIHIGHLERQVDRYKDKWWQAMRESTKQRELTDELASEIERLRAEKLENTK